MKNISFYLMIFSLFFVTNCSQNKIIQKQYLGENGILLKNKADSKKLKFDRYRFNDFKIFRDSLKINVSYSGGCREHQFKLVAKNYFGDSTSPNAELILSHNSNMDPCEAYLTEEYSFILLPLQYEYIKKFGKESGEILLVLDEKEIEYSF